MFSIEGTPASADVERGHPKSHARAIILGLCALMFVCFLWDLYPFLTLKQRERKLVELAVPGMAWSELLPVLERQKYPAKTYTTPPLFAKVRINYRESYTMRYLVPLAEKYLPEEVVKRYTGPDPDERECIIDLDENGKVVMVHTGYLLQ